jgi:hypothetical protein
MVTPGLRIFLRSAFVLATVAVFSASCSRQAEGERCDYDWAGQTQDCDSGLQCTPCGNLQTSVVDRCCRVDGTYADPRCAPAAAPTQIACNTHTATTGNGSGGTGGSGTAGSGTAGSGTAGAGKGGAGTGGGSAGSTSSGNAGEATAGSGGG